MSQDPIPEWDSKHRDPAAVPLTEEWTPPSAGAEPRKPPRLKPAPELGGVLLPETDPLIRRERWRKIGMVGSVGAIGIGVILLGYRLGREPERPEILRPIQKPRSSGESSVTPFVMAFNLARQEADRGNLAKSRTHYEHAIESVTAGEDPSQALNNLAILLVVDGGNLERAERLARKALTIHPQNIGFAHTLGVVLHRLERYEEARSVLEHTLASHDEKPEYWAIKDSLGDVLYSLGLKNEALQYWAGALRDNPEHEGLTQKVRRATGNGGTY